MRERCAGANDRVELLVRQPHGNGIGLGGPSLVVLTGMAKPFRKTFTERDYARVRQLGDEYRSRVPRSVLR